MVIGVAGRQGHGKTLITSILGTYISSSLKVPLSSNYPLLNSTLVHTISDLEKIKNGVFCFDEAWLTIDSRNYKGNVDISAWINQARKNGLLMIYTSQTIGQVDNRLRFATDYLVFCKKKRNGSMWFHFIDYQYGTMLKQFKLEKPEIFYDIYDTSQVLQKLK